MTELLGPEDVAEMDRDRWREARRGFVYFVEAVGTNRIKIGFTAGRDPNERLRSLQTSCPFPLLLLASQAGTMQTEYDLHRRFARERVMQCAEWFHASLDLRWYIEELRP